MTPNDLDVLVETPREVWGRRRDGHAYVLEVWRDGQRVEQVAPTALPTSPVRARQMAWSLSLGMAIEREVHDDAVVVRRLHLNGPVHTSIEPAGATRELLRGFRDVSPWEIPPFGRFHRQFVRWVDGKADATRMLSVAGSEVRVSGGIGKPWHHDPKHEPCASPEAAIARHEETAASLVRDGYTLRLIELLDATRYHPAPPLTRTEDPYDAVDMAMARIRELRAQYPAGHFCVEEIDPTRDAAILERHGYSEFFCEMHAERFGRWASIPEAPRTGSSFEYFLARYQSVTWIIADPISTGLPMFYCGNVSGGGWCCLEIGDLEVDLEDTAEVHPGRGYEIARVFHGGWGRTGYLFDRRVATPTGEHPIYEICLDGAIDELMPEQPTAPETIEAFGHWLEREVHQIASELAHRLPYYQP
ncbi:MAG: hypothetical protein SFX73_21580 [Kofleriaceae bacterium]|nr:hypothetical protein [Kofleriaceae bacterium]